MDIALVTAEAAWQMDEDVPLLLRALDDLGISAGPVRWDDPDSDWSSFEMAVLKSPWDYTGRHREFMAWVDRAASLVPLFNSPDVIRWNSDKRYLAEIGDLGIPVVATHYFSPQDLTNEPHQSVEPNQPGGPNPRAGDDPGGLAERLRGLLWEFSTSEDPESNSSIVVKPTISAGSKDTARYDAANIENAADHVLRLLEAGREVMIQPYLPNVEDFGETGLVYFGTDFSHAFRKGPLLSHGASEVDGLFAVEKITARTPSPAERELADLTLKTLLDRFAAPEVLYARIDLLSDDHGRPRLLELELVEPSYFLTTDAESADRAAAAYAAALGRLRGR